MPHGDHRAISRRDRGSRAPEWDRRIDSVGRAQSGVEIAILDPRSQPAPPGEIAVRGLRVMPGYWQAPEASAATLANGWLLTGDRGTCDAWGYVTLLDRSKDVIISGGTNIYPREVEEALLTHPAVSEVAVIGRPSAEWGEDVLACVVAAPGAVCDEAVPWNALQPRCSRYSRDRPNRAPPR